MKRLDSKLKIEARRLENIIKSIRKRLEKVPKGSLHIIQSKENVEYYYREEGSTKETGRYIKKKDLSLAKQIAQRDYDRKVLALAIKRCKAVNQFRKIMEETNLGKIYSNLHKARKSLLEEAILSDEEYIKQWESVEYSGKGFEIDAPEIITEKGERVRSKSEKMIADKLYAKSIPYRYEYPVQLSNGKNVYPDFTVLKMPEREEVYLEHFGMIDDRDYLENMLYKLSTYERNGIFLGINLFMTHETRKNPLSMQTLVELIHHIF